MSFHQKITLICLLPYMQTLLLVDMVSRHMFCYVSNNHEAFFRYGRTLQIVKNLVYYSLNCVKSIQLTLFLTYNLKTLNLCYWSTFLLNYSKKNLHLTCALVKWRNFNFHITRMTWVALIRSDMAMSLS